MNPYKIWNEAKKIIPGGNSLISKRPERFLPKYWPTYYKSSKGILITDINKKKYFDFAQMGYGTSTLGYCNKTIDNAVRKSIKNGITTTLNCLEEFYLAREILKIDKFADQVKFARGGGEAMSIAIRLARASSGKDQIAFSGYHGWNDWYLATNLNNENNLKKHLLPGLKPKGVPKKLKNTIFPFEYGNISELKKIIKNKNIGTIVIEGSRYFFPEKKFVKQINYLCKKNKIILIIDEITSGWRQSVGGIYKEIGFRPDVVVYGKGIANGYPLSIVVGKKKIISESNNSFISSSSWTERIGFAAGIAAIKFFKKKKVHKHIILIGKIIQKSWIKIANKYNLKLKTNNYVSLCTFFFNYGKLNEKLYTYFTQEMLKYNYIANNSVYISYAHKKKDVTKYIIACERVFKKIKDCIESNKIPLKGPERSMAFKRLNVK
jgi:glutamate-1-semialdehyde 2,1-aminomutase